MFVLPTDAGSTAVIDYSGHHDVSIESTETPAQPFIAFCIDLFWCGMSH